VLLACLLGASPFDERRPARVDTLPACLVSGFVPAHAYGIFNFNDNEMLSIFRTISLALPPFNARTSLT